MLTQLQLKNFRNHKNIDLQFKKPLVAIIGPNAVGKTNILEAIYVSSFTKSFRTSDTKLILSGDNFYTIDRYDDKNHTHIRFQYTGGHRQKKANFNSVATPLIQIIGRKPLTLFEPNDLTLFTGLPSARRKYLDKILTQVDKNYLTNLNLYIRLLQARNAILKKNKTSPISNLQELLFVYTVQMANPATYITKSRKKFLQYFKKNINTYYEKITSSQPVFQVSYQSCSMSLDDFLSQIELHQSRDIQAGFSCYGPHREDFTILQNNKALSEWSSRGEQRSLVLASKLIELDYIEKQTAIRPILLLDDVLSELDEMRQKYLLNTLSLQQTFFTATHLPLAIQQDFQKVNLPL